MKKRNHIVASLALFGIGAISGVTMNIYLPSVGFAATTDSQSAVCEAIGSGTECDENATGSASVTSIIQTAIRILSIVVGVAAVIMIVVAGFKYIASGGDSSKIASAKNTLVYALVGLVVAVLAQVIVRFVLTQAATAPAKTCPSGQVLNKDGDCVMKVNKL